MAKKIIFRADGNSQTGLGHLYRIFALVEVFRNEFDYIIITKASSVTEVIPEGYSYTVIPDSVEIDKEPKWISDNYSSDEYFIIADGYQFDDIYQKNITEEGYYLVYIDDLVSKNISANLIINHSLNIDSNDYQSNEYTKFALGPKYAILRPGFIKEARKKRKIDSIDTIFVSFGGADFYDLTNRCLEGIINLKNIKKIHVVLGSAYKHSEIYDTIKGAEKKVFLHSNISENQMIDLMKQCQLAIVPSSTISYEVCSVKMIILSGYYVDNQMNIYNGLKSNGLIYSAGDFNLYSPEMFKQKVQNILADNQDNYQKKIDSKSHLFDGMQNERILSLIIAEYE